MKVPLLDLKAQHATIREEVLAAVTDVLDSQICIGGPKVAELEQTIAAISDCKYARGCLQRHRRIAVQPDGSRHWPG